MAVKLILANRMRQNEYGGWHDLLTAVLLVAVAVLGVLCWRVNETCEFCRELCIVKQETAAKALGWRK